MKRFLKAAILGVVVLGGCSGPPAEKVTNFTAFVASDKVYAGEAPEGWEIESGDFGNTVSKSTIQKGSAMIRITADTASSFLADGMRGGSRPAIEIIHEKGLEKLNEYFSSPDLGPLSTMNSMMGPARYTEFIADGGNTHGYRCTIQGGERVVYVTTSCPQSDWETLKPAFIRTIGSLKAGGG